MRGFRVSLLVAILGVAAARPSDSLQTAAVPEDSSHVSPAPGGGGVSKSNRADTVLVVRHVFNHREQIIAGGVIMACLAGMLVIMNNYNPR